MIIFLIAFFMQSVWAEEGLGPVNALIDQFKSAERGGSLSLSDMEGEWTCEFHSLERDGDMPTLATEKTEHYNLTLVKKRSRGSNGDVVASDDILSLEAEIVSRKGKSKSIVQVMMGPRRVVSGRAVSPALDEMAHDIDLDTMDEIAISHNGTIKTLIIERSYFYKGPYHEFFESENIEEWKRRMTTSASIPPSKILVPRAYSVCVKAI